MGADAGEQGWSQELSDRGIAQLTADTPLLVFDTRLTDSLINECLHLRAEVAKLQGMVADLSRKLIDTQLPGPDLGGEGC